jgi:formylglycine-generating enzyme required for sulfatase activity
VELGVGVIVAGRLRLLRPLGQGGMGVVWAARHLSLDTDVAVKFIRPERACADPLLLARFEREARATARIAHPNVVKIMDYGMIDNSVPYIVMELLRGFSLAEVLEKGGRFSLSTARVLLQQVGSALESAHELGIIHRDIKPQNLFIQEGSLTNPLLVKVLDFGVAKIRGDLPSGLDSLTETGIVIGSAPYMSPEQLEGRKDVDRHSDLWSLAVILYEVLTGSQPFLGTSFVAIGASALSGRYRLATELREDLPAAIDEWFARALCTEIGGRFSSAREMVEAFPKQEVAQSATGSQSNDTSGTRDLARTLDHCPARKKKRSRRCHWGLTALTIVGVAFGLYVEHRGKAAKLLRCPEGMVLIKGTEFRIGSAADADIPTDETIPNSKVASLAKVNTFCLDVTEVTVADYSTCKGCERPRLTVEFEGLTPKGRDFESQFCNQNIPDKQHHPMNCVDWNEASTYCKSLGKHLPTEAEWELAARGTQGRTFPWGEDQPNGTRLNACGEECSRMLSEKLEKLGKGTWPSMHTDNDRAETTSPVGQYTAGATDQGVQDLAGNVWEWTDSKYCPYPFDSTGDCGDSRRVLRGGGWDTTEILNVRSARRYPSAPTARGKSLGFRCAVQLGRN